MTHTRPVSAFHTGALRELHVRPVKMQTASAIHRLHNFVGILTASYDTIDMYKPETSIADIT